MRIGGDKVIPVDVRIIAATNKNLKQMVKNNLFREDLYYRLAVLEINIPPLRERPEDIIPLFITFLTEISGQENKSIYWDSISIFKPLLTYDWPGNVRELRNFCERVVILFDKNKLTESFISDMILQKHNVENAPTYTTEITSNLRELEANYINFLLHKFGNNKEKLCSFLNISKTTLWRKLNNS
jgi:transcriptional regulator with PAS, ATPase and Fis domain